MAREKEEVTVTLDFSKKGAFGLKNNNANNNQSVLTDITFKVQDLSVSLRGMICYHEGENTYLRLDKWYNNPGQINISVPNSALINSVTLGTNGYKIANLNAKYTYNGKEKDEEITELISKNLKTGWTIDRISTVDLSLLKLAIYEIKYGEIPYKIAINEAVNLAKKYGEEQSSSFVNGILAKVVE